MWRFFWPQESDSPKPPSFRRDRLALLVALVTAASTLTAFFLSKSTQFLMPGPLTSAHASIENCSSCHSKSGDGKLSWIHGLVAGNPIDDSKACITCHKMPATAFFPHGASADVLLASTKRLTKVAASTPEPLSARAQNAGFPAHDVVSRGLTCATCHQEHKGANFKLGKISNEQCRSCHVVKFDSFDGHHPQFENYPFDRRTQIIYDHASHFEKHFPEVAKKDSAKRIPDTCSTCHDSQKDRRVMAVAPFEKTCTGCHLDQITGKERATGPKGIAFLALPGLDLQTLKNKNAAIGEWPEASEAGLTPFLKVMISRTEKGRALIKTVDKLNLQDLANASDDQITAVKDLIWEIKRLLYALISGKASDVLGDLNIGSGGKLSASLVADLTASIPRDVVVGAQQQWLPNLAREITGGPKTSDPQPAANDPEPSNSSAATSEEPAAADTPAASDEPQSSAETDEKKEAPSENASGTKYDPPACLMRVLGQCLMPAGQENKAEGANPEGGAGKDDSANATSNGGKEKRAAGSLPEPMRAGLQDARPAESAQVAGEKATSQSDELLRPTEEELREMKSRSNDRGRAPEPRAIPSQPDTASTSPAKTAPVVGIESNIDPESWAEYGGWYRQDYAIFYRPAGHKDKFIYSWLFLTGPQAPKGDRSPAAAVFDFLTSKDAQGSCTKCHSVDDIQGKGRVVNFSPSSAETKLGRFTTFIHEPHLGVMQNRGCLTCHSLEKNRPYLKSYEQGNPHNFASNFGAVNKDLCQSCHAAKKVRQDCLTCHKYHVNGVITPIMQTKIPMQ